MSPPDQQATYLIAASSPLTPEAAELLGRYGRQAGSLPAPDGKPALIVLEVTGSAGSPIPATLDPPVSFTDKLTLVGATLEKTDAGGYVLWLEWRTAGPDPAGWRGYRLEVASNAADPGGDGWQVTLPFEAFRPTEWVSGGHFITWHQLEGLDGEPPARLGLRLIDQRDGMPVGSPDSPDGWHDIIVRLNLP